MLFLSRCHSCYQSRRTLFTQSQFTVKCSHRNSHSSEHRYKLQVYPWEMLFRSMKDCEGGAAIFFLWNQRLSLVEFKHTMTNLLGGNKLPE